LNTPCHTGLYLPDRGTHPSLAGASFPAENLFEYQWPQEKIGDYWMLQEQVSEFLGVSSFKRKHPDLVRR
jgi:hypothetical protein